MKRIMDSSQRGSKTSNCVLAAVFALIAACAAKADTVVWYTFDDLGDVGTRISDSSTIQNKANPGTHNATVYGIKQGYIKDATSVNLPYVTNGVPEFTRMWDPVSGSSASGTDRALRFPSTNAGGQGALLEVETDASLRPESFTAEALFRYPDPNWNLDANGWNRLVVMPNDAGYAWEIVVKWHNQVGFHFMANDGSVTNRDWVVAPASGNWNDCMWHHVALSVEQGETTSTVKMYLDYALKATKTLNYRISYSSSNLPIQIGARSEQGCLGNFCGELGEFRFSNTTLTPAQFLRPRSMAARANFDPDCVLYYDFEDFSEDWSWFAAALGEVVNKADPGIMGGTIITKNSLAPEFVEDSPVEWLRQSMTSAAYETSEKSLMNSITSASSREDGYIECMPLDVEWFSKTNFTVECFFKTENMTQIYTPLFRRWGGWNVQVNIGVGGTGGYMGINISTNALYNQTERPISSFTAGTWNHVALVVDQIGETKTLKTYFNRKLIETFPLPSNLANTNRNGSGPHYEKWFVAGADGGNSFDGKVDSMRVTLRALEPQEFLTARPYTSGSTIAHISFDDETPNASAAYGALRQSVYQGNAKDEIGYSDDVPGVYIRDGLDGELITKHNLKSISFPDTTNHAWVSYGNINGTPLDVYYIHTTTNGQYHTSGTIEFWMKTNQQDVDYDTALLSVYSPRTPILIGFGPNSRLRIGFRTSEPWAEGKYWTEMLSSTTEGFNLVDGKWHHIAFTYRPNPEDAGKFTATGYIDYKVACSSTWLGHLNFESDGYKPNDVRFAGQHNISDGNGHKNFGGLIDELRFSDVALEPSQFLRAEHAPGLSIFIR